MEVGSCSLWYRADRRVVVYMSAASSALSTSLLIPPWGAMICSLATTIVLFCYLQVSTDTVAMLELMTVIESWQERKSIIFTLLYSQSMHLFTFLFACRCASPLAQTSAMTSSTLCFVLPVENAALSFLPHPLWCELLVMFPCCEGNVYALTTPFPSAAFLWSSSDLHWSFHLMGNCMQC